MIASPRQSPHRTVLAARHVLSALVAILAVMLIGSARAAETPEIEVRVEKNDDTFTVDAGGTIPVSVTTAWNVLTDFDHLASIMNNLSSSRITGQEGNTLTIFQQGKARYGVFSYSFESVREIILEPRRRILSRQISGKAKRFESIAELQATADGTLLRYHADIVPEGQIARLFGAPFIKAEIDEQLTLMAVEMMRREGKRAAEKPAAKDSPKDSAKDTQK